MALLDDEGRNLLIGLAIGAGAAIFARDVLPSFREAGRPLAKAALKSGIVAFDRVRESLAAWAESAEDLVAEVREEMHSAQTSGEEAGVQTGGGSAHVNGGGHGA